MQWVNASSVPFWGLRRFFFDIVKSSYKVQKPGKRPDLPYNKKLSIWRWAKKCSQLSGQSFSPPPPMLVWMDHFPKGGLTLNKLFFKTLPSWCNTSSLSYKSYKRCFPIVVLPGVMATPHQCAGLRLSQEVSAKPNRLCCCCRRASRFKFQNIHSLWISSMQILTKNLIKDKKRAVDKSLEGLGIN